MCDCVDVSRTPFPILAHLKTEEVVMDLIVGRSDPSTRKRFFFFSFSFGKGKQQRREQEKMEKSRREKKIKTTAPVAMDDGVESQAVFPRGGEILDADTRVLGRSALGPSQ
jgi:hypothetical protein